MKSPSRKRTGQVHIGLELEVRQKFPTPPVIIVPGLREEYELVLGSVLDGASEMERGSEKYWWGLWEIRSKNLWRADQDKLSDWLGWWAAERQGCSVETFYTVTNMIQFCLVKQGMTEDEVRSIILSQWKVALGADIRKYWLQRVRGELVLRPEVEEALRDSGEDPRQAILRIADLGKGEARDEVRRFSEKDRIFVVRGSSQYDSETGRFVCDVRWDHSEDGLLGIWRVSCTAKDVTEGRRRKDTGVVPEKVAEFMAQRLGDSL